MKNEIDLIVKESVTDYQQLGQFAQGVFELIRQEFDEMVPEAAIYKHMIGDIIVLGIQSDDESVVSFSSSKFTSPKEEFKDESLPSDEGLYLMAGIVDHNYQGKGLAKQMGAAAFIKLLDHKFPFVFTRTQNPRVEESIEKSLQFLVDNNQISSFSLNKKKIEGLYGHMLTKSKPEARKLSYPDLDYEKGDVYLLIYEIKHI